jgi:type IV pilus assembly protein PilO
MRFGIREILFVVVILGLLGSGYFCLSNMGDDKQALRRDVQAKQKALADLQQSTAGISDLGRKIADLQKAIAFFESKLPQHKEMDKVLKEVWQLATANNLNTRTIKPLKSERGPNYSEQPIQMSLSGDFDGFYAFLLQLEKLPRITRITQMQLQKIPDRDGQMQAQLTLSIFFEPELAAPAVAGSH